MVADLDGKLTLGCLGSDGALESPEVIVELFICQALSDNVYSNLTNTISIDAENVKDLDYLPLGVELTLEELVANRGYEHITGP